jgi:arsenate reductase
MRQVIGRNFMKLYGLKNCDSCKKALSQLRAAGHEIAFFDIRTDPLDYSQIADLLARYGDQVVLNRKSTTWRNLAESDRLLSPRTLLAMHPKLIKRPIIFHNGSSYVGWSKDVQTAFGVE